jgi:hypothetical protein
LWAPSIATVATVNSEALLLSPVIELDPELLNGVGRPKAVISRLADGGVQVVIGVIAGVPGVTTELAGVAGLLRVTGVLVDVREPCEFVVEIVEFAGLEVGSRGCDRALERHGSVALY